jgi:hypothetical protein
MTAAAAVPVVRRNARRVGFDGPDSGSSGIEPPVESIAYFSHTYLSIVLRDMRRRAVSCRFGQSFEMFRFPARLIRRSEEIREVISPLGLLGVSRAR